MNEQIMELIREINEYEDFDADTDLFETGILDSLSLVLLINRIEEAFGVFIPEEMVTLDRFTTVERMAGVIRSLREG